MKIYFVTGNDQKVSEARDYVKQFGGSPVAIELCAVKHPLQEILHRDIDLIVKNKALQAYQYLSVPCVVEHSGLFMDALKNLLPGGLGQIIWDAVGDRMCDFLRADDSRKATARSVIGYCDGRRVRLYAGETQGRVAEKSRGQYVFNWDPVFVPDGSDQTYGEMGPEKKRATSPFAKAWKKFLDEEFFTNHRVS
jgi:XTP/dITP diphosphohydrolase